MLFTFPTQVISEVCLSSRLKMTDIALVLIFTDLFLSIPKSTDHCSKTTSSSYWYIKKPFKTS